MIVEVRTHLPADPHTVLEHAQRPALLNYVAAPLVTFRSLEPSGFPERWTEGEQHKVAMRAFGVVPLGTQTIRIDMQQFQPNVLRLRDNGGGQLARVWDHAITIEPEAGGARYQDNIVIKAGLLTPCMWLFAIFFFRWRQHRWRKVVARGFRY